ncbi:hypothetical protein C8J57DRAFT_1301083 [Mycena rebaudengoi]|nr:hypothetical protein C8J57DRAFT_1301083 [Mycena rebaudengoi]
MINTTEIDTVWDGTLQSVLKTEIVLFMYGIHVILVVLAIWFLCKRQPAGWPILGGLAGAMFVLGTTEVALQAITTALWLRTLYSAARDDSTAYYIAVESLQRLGSLVTLAELLLTITNNGIADSLLIYRCYVIWKTSRKEVVIVPVLLAFATTALGYVASYQIYVSAPSAVLCLRTFFGMMFGTNVAVTGLTVGRIRYTSRGLETLGQTKFLRRYKSAITLLLESAVLYLVYSSAAMIGLAVARSVRSTSLSVSIGIGAPLMNIIPALIIVQVSLRQETPSAKSKMLPH